MSAAIALILAAGAFADLAAIDYQVIAFTGVPTGAEGGASLPVDRRLRLAPCRSPLALSWRTAQQQTVIVECPDAGGWRLFVPVRRNAVAPAAAVASAAPAAVNRGDPVTIAVAGDGFTVSQPGEALESGATGTWIRVRTAAAKSQPLRVRVVRPGLVELPMP